MLRQALPKQVLRSHDASIVSDPPQIEKGSVWVFEQTQALDFFDVYTPVRMTVIKLSSGGLWVHCPVAPTDECIRLIKVRPAAQRPTAPCSCAGRRVADRLPTCGRARLHRSWMHP